MAEAAALRIPQLLPELFPFRYRTARSKHQRVRLRARSSVANGKKAASDPARLRRSVTKVFIRADCPTVFERAPACLSQHSHLYARVTIRVALG
jgi:hypothetical protein